LWQAGCWAFSPTALPDLADKPFTAIYLISETIVVVMIACRRSTNQISLRAADWVFGFAGTFLPLMVTRSGGAAFLAGGLFLLLGFGITVGAQLSLCRSFGIVAANRGVKTTGLYAVVRHPMYMGYFLTHVGFLLTNPTLWNVTRCAAWAGCQLRRIDAEERVLSADLAYVAFTQRVPYRLVPFVY
jgi:protein-S-isoprenylcysteine O-methyltransferase Ste14